MLLAKFSKQIFSLFRLSNCQTHCKRKVNEANFKNLIFLKWIHSIFHDNMYSFKLIWLNTCNIKGQNWDVNRVTRDARHETRDEKEFFPFYFISFHHHWMKELNNALNNAQNNNTEHRTMYKLSIVCTMYICVFRWYLIKLW